MTPTGGRRFFHDATGDFRPHTDDTVGDRFAIEFQLERLVPLANGGRLHGSAHVLGGAGFGREGVHAAEVIGSAGLFFDPGTPPAIAARINELLADPARAGQLRRAARERAAHFTWDRGAELAEASFRRCLGQG